MDQEPSVLDFVKTRIHQILHTSAAIEETKESVLWVEEEEKAVSVRESTNQTLRDTPFHIPWRVLLALGLGLWAQLSLEPHQASQRTWQMGAVSYILAGLVLIWINWRNEWTLPAWDVDVP